MQRSKRKTGSSALALDFAKAFDKLEWQFIEKVEQACHLEKIIPLKPSRGGLQVPILAFVDDCLLFFKNDRKSFEGASRETLNGFAGRVTQGAPSQKFDN
ncbi:hypothetical protein ACH5RR_036680 [Cinchona calisaya]|uniref:Reverse transcriptase n=1 Tax=Cinchona calisaya TaxID=153742 RepID=A0ABD2Y5C1_9GENT